MRAIVVAGLLMAGCAFQAQRPIQFLLPRADLGLVGAALADAGSPAVSDASWGRLTTAWVDGGASVRTMSVPASPTGRVEREANVVRLRRFVAVVEPGAPAALTVWVEWLYCADGFRLAERGAVSGYCFRPYWESDTFDDRRAIAGLALALRRPLADRYRVPPQSIAEVQPPRVAERLPPSDPDARGFWEALGGRRVEPKEVAFEWPCAPTEAVEVVARAMAHAGWAPLESDGVEARLATGWEWDGRPEITRVVARLELGRSDGANRDSCRGAACPTRRVTFRAEAAVCPSAPAMWPVRDTSACRPTNEVSDALQSQVDQLARTVAAGVGGCGAR